MAERRKLNGTWDAKRVLYEYLQLADSHGDVKEVDWSDDSPYGIEQRRFAAVMRAYGKDLESFFPFEGFISSSCSPEKIAEVRQFLKDNLAEDFLKRQIDNPEFIIENRDIRYMFEALFKYRKRLLEVEKAWSGLMECSMSVVMVVKATNNLYQKHIKSVSDSIDRMLILLMGDDFDKSFSEEELLPFGYPDVTDGELQNMIMDNF